MERDRRRSTRPRTGRVGICQSSHLVAKRIRRSGCGAEGGAGWSTGFLFPWVVNFRVAGSLAMCVWTSGLIARHSVLRGRVSSPVVTIGVAAVAANVGLLPVAHPLYDMVASNLLPVATSLFIFGADLRRWRIAGRTGVAFAIGAFGTLFGSSLAYLLFSKALGEGAKMLAGVLTATYIGGTVNYLSVAQILQSSAGSTNPTLLAAGLAVDNVLMVVYLSVLFALGSRQDRRRRSTAGIIAGESTCDEKAVATSPAPVSPTETARGTRTVVFVASLRALGLASVLCVASYCIAITLGLPVYLSGIPVVAVVTALASSVLPNVFSPLSTEATSIANIIFTLFFASVGAGADLMQLVGVGAPITLFAAVTLLVHGLTTFVIGSLLLKLPAEDLLIASNANVGGAGTAAAFASEMEWKSRILPAILAGTFGYLIATPMAILLITLLP